MTDLISKRETCRLCDSPKLTLALPLKPSALADEFLPYHMSDKKQSTYPLDLYLCEDCGFSQLVDIVIPSAIYVDYTYETKSSLGLVEHFKRYANDVTLALQSKPADFVVDIGSNDGSLLRQFQNLGCQVLGIDPARGIAKRATEEGVETLPDFFTLETAQNINQRYRKAKIITANNIYANVDELREFTKAVRELLDDDGVFVMESFYALSWIKNMVFDFMYHEHLSYFSVKPLEAFYKTLDLELIDVWPIPTKGGSIRCFVQKAGGARKRSPSVDKFIAEEKAFGLHDLKTYQNFEKAIDLRKAATRKFLEEAHSQGKSIAGFGASATTTTLMHHFETQNDIEFIVDDYTVKQNTLSPGHHIPVFSPATIYEKNPDYVFIFAWRYADQIIAKHKDYLKAGGKFIVPLPDLKIVDINNAYSILG